MPRGMGEPGKPLFMPQKYLMTPIVGNPQDPAAPAQKDEHKKNIKAARERAQRHAKEVGRNFEMRPAHEQNADIVSELNDAANENRAVAGHYREILAKDPEEHEGEWENMRDDTAEELGEAQEEIDNLSESIRGNLTLETNARLENRLDDANSAANKRREQEAELKKLRTKRNELEKRRDDIPEIERRAAANGTNPWDEIEGMAEDREKEAEKLGKSLERAVRGDLGRADRPLRRPAPPPVQLVKVQRPTPFPQVPFIPTMPADPMIDVGEIQQDL